SYAPGNLGAWACGFPSHVEPEEQHIAVLHDIVPPLQPKQPFLPDASLAPTRDQVVVMIDLRSDESPFHVGMDLPGRLGSLRALADRPGTGLNLAGGEERDDVQELIGCADQPAQASFAYAKFPDVVRPLFGRQR